MAVGLQVYFFLELTTTYCYVCSLYARIRIRTPTLLLFLKPIFIICMASLIPPTPRTDATTNPQSYSDPAPSTLRTVHTHRTSREVTAKIVFSLYGDDHNTGTRQTPKVSSAIAEIYHCRILAEVQLAHDCRQIMVQAQGGGRVLL